jgi:Flp pilus assembly protein TadB
VATAAISSVAERTIYISFLVALLIVLVVCLSVWWFGPFRVRTRAESSPEQLDEPR